MPLYKIDTPHYLNRKRVFIDTDLRNPDLSVSPYNCVFNLDTQYEKVQSIELVGYNIPRFILPTFVQAKTHEDGTTSAGNNILDVRLRDVPFTRELVFPVEFPESYFRTSAEMTAMIPGLFEAAMDAQGDAFFNTGAGVGFTATVDTTQGREGTILVISDISGDETVISMEYLFATGDNKENSAWKVMGFIENQDVGGTTLAIPTAFNDPYPSRPPLLVPFRFLDIFIDEFDELNPIARVYLTDRYTIIEETYFDTGNHLDHSSYNRLQAPRLLSSEPLRKIDTFNMTIRFEDNIRPFEEFRHLGMDFIFDMIVLSPEQEIPCWVEQRLTY